MPKTLTFYNSATGAVVTNLAVECVGEWVSVVPGQPYSFESDQSAGATGEWIVEGTNADPANWATDGTPTPNSRAWIPPVQPSGAAGVTSITVWATHAKMRPHYVPASGGSSTTFAGRVELGAGGVLVIPPGDSAIPGQFTPTPAQAAYSSYLRG